MNEINKNNNDFSNDDEEYKNYRNSLIFYHECPACHYAQGMIFFGIGFFSAVRMQFIWSTLNLKQILLYSTISLGASSLGLYKFTYAYHVYTVQGKMKKYRE